MNQVVVCKLAPSVAVELILEASSPTLRRQEPVSCGIPLPRGALHNPAGLRLTSEQGKHLPLQTRILDRWPDSSIRWLLLDWRADVNEFARCHLSLPEESNGTATSLRGIRAISSREGLRIDTGVADFVLLRDGPFPFASVQKQNREVLDTAHSGFSATDENGKSYTPRIQKLQLIEPGPLRASVRFIGELVAKGCEPLADFMGWLHFFADSATVRFEITLRNPRRATHDGGWWELGDGGSVFLRDAGLTLSVPGQGTIDVACSPEPKLALQPSALPLELYQDSSGGDNWRSTNHVNRHGVVPNAFCGYRLRSGTAEYTGQRATPLVTLERGPFRLALAMEHFWQNFPKAVEATENGLTLRLFPSQYADVHELQGGEQKTHSFHVAFGDDPVSDEPLAWCRNPLKPRATPEWYCGSGALPYLTPKSTDPNETYLQLVDSAIVGNNTFRQKREVIDEYGWRHFGDIYGDHEAVRNVGPAPLVSHYNNQYDALAGLAIQFLRSGDMRWWQPMAELAAHLVDIDIYHTDRDKPAYNHGLFWHTGHYLDADKATHRTYPRSGRICGGGPGNEQNYATGLMLHYFLTGDISSREAAIGLGQWVINMDDGRKTHFRWLCRANTGNASASRFPAYHGPGRGAGNSIGVLLDAHRLCGESCYLSKAEQLIRRCIHPRDDISTRNLLDRENRWFYTIFLQALGRYLDHKADLGQLDAQYGYARACLLHYARWMAENEFPYLDEPEKLEFPTETWAAQEMRKSEVFKYAAKHAAGSERNLFLERSEFFFSTCTSSLAGMKTRSLVRPVVLLMCNGPTHAYFQRHPDVTAPEPTVAETDFGQPEIFVPQKVLALARLKVLGLGGAVIFLLALVYLLFKL